MATTTFTDRTGNTAGTKIVADWLNDVDFLTYDVFGGASSVGADGTIWVSNGTKYVEESGATARTSLGLGTGDSPQFTAIELGNASDTTIARASAGEISVEGTQLAKLDGVLQDLDTLGAPSSDGEIIVATGAGAFAYESGATARTSLSAQEDVITTRGDVVRGSSAGAAERLAVGTASQVLRTDGTDVSWGSPVTLGTEQATTSGTTVDFTIPSGVKLIVVSGESVSTGSTSDLIIQIGDSGGVEASGYAGGAQMANQTTLDANSAGFKIVGASVTAATGQNFTIILALKDPTNFTWSESGQSLRDDEATGSFTMSIGNKTLSAELTTVRLTTESADTFDGGSVNILYL